ncbi:MAG: hypothetical protein V6Z86_01545 [Hyphomicrobiales bacterium]
MGIAPVNFSAHIIVGNIIYYLTENLDLDASWTGLVLGLSAGGAIIGATMAPYFIGRVHPGRLVLGCVAGSAAGTAMLLAGQNLGVWIVVAGRAVTMACATMTVVTNVHTLTQRQRSIPNRYLSCTVAITRTISSNPPCRLPRVAGSHLLTMFGGDMDALIAISAAVLLLCAVVGLFTPFVSRRS